MAALAGIGAMPDTIEDRAVIIRMRRRAPGETVAPFRHRRDRPALRTIAAQLTTWLRTDLTTLEAAQPPMPVEDRAADTWEPSAPRLRRCRMTTARAEISAALAQLAQALTNDTPQPIPERPIPERVLLTVEEAAEQLRIGRTTAWRLVSNGELESVRIGTLRRVPTSAVAEFAAHLIAQSRKPA